MPRESEIVARFGTRAALNAAAAANGLSKGEILLIDDEARFAVGTSASTYQAMMKQGEAATDPWTWQKLAADNTVGTTAFANVTGLSFAGLANETYLVELYGAYQTVATTTGIALALDIPAGAEIIGLDVVATTATSLGGTEQIADAATTGATTGVRAANTNTPITFAAVVKMGATAGTIQMMQRSEIAASNTVLKAGLTIMGRRVIP